MSYTTKTTDEIKNNIILNLITNVDEINDANVGSVLDMFVTAMSQELSEQYDDIETVYNSTRITTATNTDLEELGKIVGISRLTGDKATGSVTFKLNNASSTNFTIPINTIVSTQPNTAEEQFKFLTTESKIFYKTITAESHTYKDGVNKYKLNSRFFEATTVTGDISSTPTELELDSDYEILEYNGVIIDVSSIGVLDDCETADWTEISADTDTMTTNTDDFIEGSKSLNLIKDGTASEVFGYEKTLASVFDLTTKSLFFNIYIDDEATLNKIDSFAIYASSDEDFENSYILSSELVVGWNQIILDRRVEDYVYEGNPDYKNLKYLQVLLQTNNISDTIAAGKIAMDFIIVASYENYIGDVINFITKLDEDSDFTASYSPLSIDIPIESESIGSKYNITIGKIEYMVTPIAQVNSIYNYSALTEGEDLETDEDLRDRILNSSDIANVSTVRAIESNVAALSFIQTCEVVDMPEQNVEDEAYIYNATTKKIVLVNKVAKDSDNLKISDTLGGSADYVKNTDYVINDNNEIDFDQGGDEPTDEATVYITYDYDKLGFFDVNISGKLGVLTESELDEVEEVVETKKAAGTKYLIVEPSYDAVSIEATITPETNYTVEELEDEIKDAIREYINNLNIAEDVLQAGIISVTMNIEGVANIAITSLTSTAYPASTGDLVVDSAHKATIALANITLT